MNTVMHSSSVPRPTFELSKPKLEQLLDALMQLRWYTEDRAPADAEAVLDAIWRTQVRLLAEKGRLSRPERLRLVHTLREGTLDSHDRMHLLVERIANILL